MSVSRNLCLVGAFALISGLCSFAQASVITFSGASTGSFTGPLTESGYTYQTVSGGLYSSEFGNPGQDMEGSIADSGGSLGITAVSGDFTFSQLDFAAENAPETITLSGYLGGSLVAVDTFTLPGTAFSGTLDWNTETANLLAGKVLDDLVITLPAQNSGPGSTAGIDNVVLDAAVASTPEPSSLILLGSGLLGAATRIYRRKKLLGAC